MPESSHLTNKLVDDKGRRDSLQFYKKIDFMNVLIILCNHLNISIINGLSHQNIGINMFGMLIALHWI